MNYKFIKRKKFKKKEKVCLYPKLIQNRKYVANKKNGGIVPEMTDPRVKFVPIGCGKCMECLKQKGREWKVRLLEEVKHQELKGYFVTYTFSNEGYTEIVNKLRKDGFDLMGYPLENQVCTKATRLYLERWRKKHKKSLRHWFVSELGGNKTERVHMHGIVWTDKEPEEIVKHWKYGAVTIGYRTYNQGGKPINKNGLGSVSEKTISYITKYVTKTDLLHKEYKPIILTSAGIGKGYFNSPDANNIFYEGTETREYYRDKSGNKRALPIYYRNYLFNEDEREQLWLHKLDEGKRYVNGVLARDDKEYYNLLNVAREKNYRLGFGNDKINWDIRRYEYQRKKLKQLQILQNGKINNLK